MEPVGTSPNKSQRGRELSPRISGRNVYRSSNNSPRLPKQPSPAKQKPLSCSDHNPLSIDESRIAGGQLWRSNLHRFLLATTPSFLRTTGNTSTIAHLYGDPTHDISRCTHCKTILVDGQRHYLLGDMWRQYSDPFGHEVALLLDGHETLSYFVPYLSALSVMSSTNVTSKDRISANIVDFPGSRTSPVKPAMAAVSAIPLPTSGVPFHIQYTENASPYHRLPLLDKIMQLSHATPQLIQAASCQLDLERSWFAVSWQPIMNDHCTH